MKTIRKRQLTKCTLGRQLSLTIARRVLFFSIACILSIGSVSFHESTYAQSGDDFAPPPAMPARSANAPTGAAAVARPAATGGQPAANNNAVVARVAQQAGQYAGQQIGKAAQAAMGYLAATGNYVEGVAAKAARAAASAQRQSTDGVVPAAAGRGQYRVPRSVDIPAPARPQVPPVRSTITALPGVSVTRNVNFNRNTFENQAAKFSYIQPSKLKVSPIESLRDLRWQADKYTVLTSVIKPLSGYNANNPFTLQKLQPLSSPFNKISAIKPLTALNSPFGSNDIKKLMPSNSLAARPTLQSLETLKMPERIKTIAPLQMVKIPALQPLQTLQQPGVYDIKKLMPVNSLATRSALRPFETLKMPERIKVAEPLQIVKLQSLQPLQPIRQSGVNDIRKLMPVNSLAARPTLQSLETLKMPERIKAIAPLQMVKIPALQPLQTLQQPGVYDIKKLMPVNSLAIRSALRPLETLKMPEKIKVIEPLRMAKAQSLQPLQVMQQPVANDIRKLMPMNSLVAKPITQSLGALKVPERIKEIAPLQIAKTSSLQPMPVIPQPAVSDIRKLAPVSSLAMSSTLRPPEVLRMPERIKITAPAQMVKIPSPQPLQPMQQPGVNDIKKLMPVNSLAARPALQPLEALKVPERIKMVQPLQVVKLQTLQPLQPIQQPGADIKKLMPADSFVAPKPAIQPLEALKVPERIKEIAPLQIAKTSSLQQMRVIPQPAVDEIRKPAALSLAGTTMQPSETLKTPETLQALRPEPIAKQQGVAVSKINPAPRVQLITPVPIEAISFEAEPLRPIVNPIKAKEVSLLKAPEILKINQPQPLQLPTTPLEKPMALAIGRQTTALRPATLKLDAAAESLRTIKPLSAPVVSSKAKAKDLAIVPLKPVDLVDTYMRQLRVANQGQKLDGQPLTLSSAKISGRENRVEIDGFNQKITRIKSALDRMVQETRGVWGGNRIPTVQPAERVSQEAAPQPVNEVVPYTAPMIPLPVKSVSYLPVVELNNNFVQGDKGFAKVLQDALKSNPFEPALAGKNARIFIDPELVELIRSRNTVYFGPE